ncbi:MAG: radical SAM protein, partial [Anaerolineales bacterium]|nr:radical SAM protein [Anaerolineales bacterium]
MTTNDPQSVNMGSRLTPKLRMVDFPNADAIVREGLLAAPRPDEAVDIMLVNPPTPDGGLWIRTQHRVGRRTRENMVWPQVSLAQMAALLHPVYKVKVVDCNAERMGWHEFTQLLDKYQPKYYLTQLTAPTLENDLYGCFLAHARGAKTIAFGTHITPIPAETMRPYPSLDFALVGEPDLTIRDLLDHLEGKFDQRSPEINAMFTKTDPSYKPSLNADGTVNMHGIKGIAWRKGGEVSLSPDTLERLSY